MLGLSDAPLCQQVLSDLLNHLCDNSHEKISRSLCLIDVRQGGALVDYHLTTCISRGSSSLAPETPSCAAKGLSSAFERMELVSHFQQLADDSLFLVLRSTVRTRVWFFTSIFIHQLVVVSFASLTKYYKSTIKEDFYLNGLTT
jgi:hypothetical protein